MNTEPQGTQHKQAGKQVPKGSMTGRAETILPRGRVLPMSGTGYEMGLSGGKVCGLC